ncbi:hypothetical protein YpsIP31758_1107 [Yersinia pseudotuberculosis IP 31758]|uniref:Uncharacterized protein n=1 Tax=Yersinia pseudotuberculosis serotype O:1b (strain IP 31758) TaxID=349747 RepID=A0A0U1QV59_YERP3|nr:hypothetical protein YpsIP31758_1107 [Yersinia pseudotuberculosis IP 31758]
MIIRFIGEQKRDHQEMTRQYRLNIHLSQRENNDDSQTTRDF